VGKTIVITGAGMGLGRALARRFAGEGETVILLGRTFAKVQELAEELGEPHFAVECDVGDPDSVRKAFARIGERHAKIDVLINNAAIYEPFMVADARDDQILSIMNTNFAGPIFTCRSAIPMMDRGGTILNVTSESVALEFPMLSLYASTKGGLERFTESLSRELEPDGIRVTTVRAGPPALRRDGHSPGETSGQQRNLGQRGVPRFDRPAARRSRHPCFDRSAPRLVTPQRSFQGNENHDDTPRRQALHRRPATRSRRRPHV
jgi:meso-butanediol dehydrogenase / (S,S)-butanediol dehydrogenase / diacetyl reductase